MSSSEPIGGFFGLEPTTQNSNLPQGILLNSARNCFEYLLRVTSPTKVFLPKYTCDVMLEPLQKLQVPFEYYEVNESLKLQTLPELSSGEYIVYTNYFGLMDEYCRELSGHYGDKLFLDCAQAYYFDAPSESHAFYSPRKFFGVPDGGILRSPAILEETFVTDDSSARMSHLYKRIEHGPEAAYEDFKINDASLSNQPIKVMSPQTRELLAGIDFNAAQKIRMQNYQYIHDHLKPEDKNTTDIGMVRCPMFYILKGNPELRRKLIEAKIFVPLYWPNVLEWSQPHEVSYKLAESLIALPIDQRYSDTDMQRVIEELYGHNA